MNKILAITEMSVSYLETNEVAIVYGRNVASVFDDSNPLICL